MLDFPEVTKLLKCELCALHSSLKTKTNKTTAPNKNTPNAINKDKLGFQFKYLSFN